MILRSGKRTRIPMRGVAQQRVRGNYMRHTAYAETGADNVASHVNTIDICVICQDIKRSPVFVKCGHSFCQNCLAQYTALSDQHPWAKLCPICRRTLEPKSVMVQDIRYLLLGICYTAIGVFGTGIVMAVFSYIT